MTRFLFVTTVVASVLTACVSVDPAATTSLSAAPSFGITTPAAASATPAATPTAAVTLPPTLSPPTAGPTPAPTVPPPSDMPPTQAPTPGAIETFGAATLLLFDDFSDPSSGWGVGTNAGGSVGHNDDVLRFDTSGDGARLWTWRSLDDNWNVVRAEAVFVPSGIGFFGLICAISEEELLGAAVNTNGGWFFFQILAGDTNIVASDPNAGWSVPVGVATSVALDCSGTELGPMRMQVSLPELGVAAIFDGGEGPVSFDRVGIYAEADSDPWSLGVDDYFAHGGTGESGMSEAAQALLLHIPDEWRDACFEVGPSSFETGGLAGVSCTLADVGGNANVVDYVQFDTTANMDAAYQQRVTNFAVSQTTGSCELGPNEADYHYTTDPDTTIGRLLCAPQTVGIRFDWTDNRLGILSTLTDFDGSYGETWDDWGIAGPE